MKKITISLLAAIAMTGACMVSFAANDFSAYEAWAKKNEQAIQYMMNQNGWSHDSDHDHHDRHGHQDGGGRVISIVTPTARAEADA